MLLLFLDTETTGLSFAKDQVIEIAGIIVNLDKQTLQTSVVTKFSSLVQLRQEMDEKITRITGISSQDLQLAPVLFKVQENWANWIEKYLPEIEAVVAHSVDFDLNFLKKENWLLPTNYKTIDTLDLSRILFPHFSAVNLEFLVTKLDLLSKLESEPNSHHRSLFDTKANYLLFTKILEFIQKYPFSNKFLHYLQKHFLPLDLIFYSKSEIKITNPKIENEPSEVQINFQGKQRDLSIIASLKYFDANQVFNLLEKWLDIPLPKSLASCLVQIYTICVFTRIHPKWEYKYHFQGKTLDFWWLNNLSQVLQKQLQTRSELKTKKAVLPRFENLIWQVKNLVQPTVKIGYIVELVDIYIQVYKSQHIDSLDPFGIHKLLQKFSSSYDFLIISLQPFLINNKYIHNPKTLSIKETLVSQKLVQVLDLLEQVKISLQENLPKVEQINNPLLHNLHQNLLQELTENDLQNHQTLEFSMQQNLLVINKTNPNFNLEKHFENILEEYPNLSLQTYLSVNKLHSLVEIFGLSDLFRAKSVQIEYTNSKFSQKIEETGLTDFTEQRIDLLEFYKQKIDLAKQVKKPIIVLAGLNSGIKDSQRILVDNFSTEDYLVLGETGSITKIASKLVHNFNGVVVIKLLNLEAILKTNNCPSFEQVWLLGKPYLNIPNFWHRNKKAHVVEKINTDFKELYLHSTINYVSDRTCAQVKLITSYDL